MRDTDFVAFACLSPFPLRPTSITGTLMRIAVLFAAALASSALAASSAFAADPTNAELAARIAGLEARMALLEGRSGAPSAAAPTSPKALVFANWEKCRHNMTREEVIELLGEPTSRQSASAVNQYAQSEMLMYGQLPLGQGGTVVLQHERVIQCTAMNFPG